MSPMQTEEGFPEWFDDGDPPTPTHPIHPEDIFKVWSDVQPGDRVRWKTASFVKRGSVVEVKKRSMVVLFDAHTKATTIPDAKWYFVEGRLGNEAEHLTIISTPANPNVKMNGHPRSPHRQEYEGNWAPDDGISPAEAAAIMGTDPKNIRRMIRSGKLRASRVGGRWVLSRKEVER